MNSRHDVRSGEGWPGRYESKCVTGESVILRVNAVVDPDCRTWKLVSTTSCLCNSSRALQLSIPQCPRL